MYFLVFECVVPFPDTFPRDAHVRVHMCKQTFEWTNSIKNYKYKRIHHHVRALAISI